MNHIHPTSVVSASAQIGERVEIGPFCMIGDHVVIGDDCLLESQVVVREGTFLGANNYIAEGAILGGLPQHKRAHGQPGKLLIGNNNSLREHVTIHRGLQPGSDTTIGDNNLFMVNAHVAHDCHIGNDTILANNVMLAGHVEVGDRAYLSGAVGVHQFCRVGAYAMVGGQAHIVKDVPPFVTVDGVSSMIVGLNRVGLRRAGFTPAELDDIKAAYRIAFRDGLRWELMLAELQRRFPSGRVAELQRFMAATRRGCIQERCVPKRATLRLHRQDAQTEAAVDRDERAA